MRFLKLTIAYDGANYVGWQVQTNGVSVQAKLEAAWQKLTAERRRITSSGRTDSGVHAEGQVCSLRTESRLPLETLQRGLNAMLPEDIVVVLCQEMPREFHAIRDAIAKTYRYQIQTGPMCNVLQRHQWWYVPPNLNLADMQTAASYLVGKHDFAAFQTVGSKRKSTVRTISRLTISEEYERFGSRFLISVTADGFLYNMVRCIAGSLAFVGKGREAPEWIRRALESKDRSNAGQNAPAHGLFLVNVEYPIEFM